MKKFVILIIGVIYLASIAFVGFLGTKMAIYDENIFVERIECINEEIKVTSSGTKQIVVKRGETKRIELIVMVYPENATNKKLEYISSRPDIAEVNNQGILTIYKNGVTSIIINSTDGGPLKQKEQIILVVLP